MGNFLAPISQRVHQDQSPIERPFAADASEAEVFAPYFLQLRFSVAFLLRVDSVRLKMKRS